MKGKKAQATNFLQMAIIGIVIAILMVTIGLQVNDTITPAMRGTSTAITNEALKDMSNTTANSLVNDDIISVSLAMNDTAAAGDYTTVNAGNYTVDTEDGNIYLTGQGGKDYGGNDSIINYSYYPHPASYNASALGTTGISTFADYWTVIAIVIVLAVIILLFGMFGGGLGGISIR